MENKRLKNVDRSYQHKKQDEWQEITPNELRKKLYDICNDSIRCDECPLLTKEDTTENCPSFMEMTMDEMKDAYIKLQEAAKHDER